MGFPVAVASVMTDMSWKVNKAAGCIEIECLLELAGTWDGGRTPAYPPKAPIQGARKMAPEGGLREILLPYIGFCFDPRYARNEGLWRKVSSPFSQKTPL